MPNVRSVAPAATGETAERLASLIRLAGADVPQVAVSDNLRLDRAREVLSWNKETRESPVFTELERTLAPATQPAATTKPAQ